MKKTNPNGIFAMAQKVLKQEHRERQRKNDPYKRTCCDNPDWRVGFLMSYCKNCGENDY